MVCLSNTATTVTFDGSSADQTITSGGLAFNHVVFNNTASSWKR